MHGLSGNFCYDNFFRKTHAPLYLMFAFSQLTEIFKQIEATQEFTEKKRKQLDLLKVEAQQHYKARDNQNLPTVHWKEYD